MYTPYGVSHIYPNSGPNSGGTDITVVGSGFVNNGQAKCRFGVPGEYSIVEATFLSESKITCRSPVYTIPRGSSFPFSVPFSVGFNKDELEPWTTSPHRFRFYDQPITERSLPSEAEVGQITEVYVHSKAGTEFVPPVPVEGLPYDDYGFSCQFGDLGKTPGTYINSTTVKCITPQLRGSPADYSRMTVPLILAQNGQNYNEYQSDTKFTFVGTATESSFWPWIMALILIFILLIAIILCIAIFLTKSAKFQTSTQGYNSDNQPHILGSRP